MSKQTLPLATNRKQYIRILLALIFAVMTTLALGVNYTIASWDTAAKAIGSQNSILVSLVKLRQNFNLYTLPWQICALLLWGAYYKLGESWKFSAIEVVAALLFGTINVIANSLVVNGNWGFVFANTYQVVVSSVCIIGQAALLLGIMKVFFKILDGIPKKKEKAAESKGLAGLLKKYPWRFSFCCLLLCWLPDLVFAYPAQTTFDGVNQLLQWMEMIPKSNAHPFFSTIIFGIFFEIGKLFGNDNFAIFFIVLSQSCIMASCYATICWKIQKMNIPQIFSIGVLAFYGLHPMMGEYAHTLIKDSISVPVFSLFMLEVAAFTMDKKNYLNKKGNCVRLVLAGILACMLRHNYKYAIIPTFLLIGGIAIWENRQNVKRVVICAVLLLGCLQTGNWLAANVLDYPAGSVREALSIPFQQTARYVKDYPGEVSAEEKEAIAAVLNYETLADSYNPNSSDPVKNTYHGDKDSLKKYLVAWGSMLCRHPETYIQATIHGSHAYYAFTSYTGVRTMADILRQDSIYLSYAQRLEMDLSHPQELEPVLITWENTRELLIRAPIVGMLCNCASYTWMLLLLGIFFCKKKEWKIWILLTPMILIVLTCIASPVNGNWRYYVPIVTSTPIIIAVSIRLLGLRAESE